jgi:hypothetical protein
MRGLAILFLFFLAPELYPQELRAVHWSALSPAQRKLVSDWVKRYNHVTGLNLRPDQLLDAAGESARATFEAVTLALEATRLTAPDGRRRGTALELLEALDHVAGRTPGARADEQFRLYVRLRRDALARLESAREFQRTMDNTAYHPGYPMSFRSVGAPTIQISVSRDGRRASIDVEYRQASFPSSLLSPEPASGLDVTAGGNFERYSRRWAGLEDWWTTFFGLPVRKRDAGETPGRAASSPPPPPRPTAEESALDFLRIWLIDQQPSRAMAYFSPRSFSCAVSSDSPPGEDRGMAVFRLQRVLQEVNASLGPVADLDKAVEPVTVEEPRARQIRATSAVLALYEVRDDAAADFECDYRFGLVERRKQPEGRYGEYYGIALRLTGPGVKGKPIYTLWAKEDAGWRIVSFEVESLESSRRGVLPAAPRVEPVPRVSGDAEMLRANDEFLNRWLLNGDIEGAAQYFHPDCLACVRLYAGQPGGRPEALLREALGRIRTEAGEEQSLEALRPVQVANASVQIVNHGRDRIYSVLRVPREFVQAANCLGRTSVELLYQRTPAQLQFGQDYATAFHVQREGVSGSAFYLLWQKREGAWVITALHVETP